MEYGESSALFPTREFEEPLAFLRVDDEFPSFSMAADVRSTIDAFRGKNPIAFVMDIFLGGELGAAPNGEEPEGFGAAMNQSNSLFFLQMYENKKNQKAMSDYICSPERRH